MGDERFMVRDAREERAPHHEDGEQERLQKY
jgi:hypothetical protein